MAQAVFKLTGQLTQLLAERNAPPASCKAYIFGGCALHLHTNARGSSDLDVELAASTQLQLNEIILELDPVFYEDPEVGQSIIVYDDTFSPTLAPLHEDYQEDAIRLDRDDQSPLWVYVVQAIDLAISKLGRYGDQDIDDIHTLFDHGLDIEQFRQRATEAIGYTPGNTLRLTGNLSHVIKSYKTAEK